jgi:hypothetical protein
MKFANPPIREYPVRRAAVNSLSSDFAMFVQIVTAPGKILFTAQILSCPS